MRPDEALRDAEGEVGGEREATRPDIVESGSESIEHLIQSKTAMSLARGDSQAADVGDGEGGGDKLDELD